jgi:hypothetical protein
MNLTDLRDELATRANSTEDRAPDLLPGVRRKITRTKRRRIAAAGAAVVAVLALAIVPTVTDLSGPEPAQTPSDVTRDDITLHGVVGPDQLDRGWIGNRGQTEFEFSWTPTTRDLALYTYCRPTSENTLYYWVQINDHTAAVGNCNSVDYVPNGGDMLPSTSTLWLDVPLNQPAKVRVKLVDEHGTAINGPDEQVAFGIYRRGEQLTPDLPARGLPTSAADYVKGDVRYRAKIGGDTLAAAAVGEPGQNKLELQFTANGAPLSYHALCTANQLAFDPQYQLDIKVNGQPTYGTGCDAATLDAGRSSSATLPSGPKAGENVNVTVTLIDKKNRPVSVPGARIGLGIYQKGQQRKVDDATLDEVAEYNGYNYRLTEVKTADATTAKLLELATPAGRPFLVAYGSSDLGTTNVRTRLTGLTTDAGNDTGGGIGTVGEAARDAGTAKLTIEAGHPTKGLLILGIYLPEG